MQNDSSKPAGRETLDGRCRDYEIKALPTTESRLSPREETERLVTIVRL